MYDMNIFVFVVVVVVPDKRNPLECFIYGAFYMINAAHFVLVLLSAATFYSLCSADISVQTTRSLRDT